MAQNIPTTVSFYMACLRSACAAYEEASEVSTGRNSLPVLERRPSEALDTAQLAFYLEFRRVPCRIVSDIGICMYFQQYATRTQVPDEKSMNNWWQKLRRQIWPESWRSTASSLRDRTWKIFTRKCFECWYYMFMHSRAAWRWQTLFIMRKSSRTKMWSRRQGLLLTRSVTLQSVTPILQLPLSMRGRNQMNEGARGWCFARGREFFTSIFYRNSGFAARICTGVGKLVFIWIACLGFLLQVCSMSVGLCLLRHVSIAHPPRLRLPRNLPMTLRAASVPSPRVSGEPGLVIRGSFPLGACL